MKYQVIIPHDVVKQLDKLPFDVETKIYQELKYLEENPRPINVKKLKGRNGWRIRVGSYRVLYIILEAKRIILVTNVGHRKDIYR